MPASIAGAALLLSLTLAPGALQPSTDGNPAAPLSDTTGGAVSTTPFVIRLVIDGIEHSDTFARIVAQLLESDVLVVIEPDVHMSSQLQGYMNFVTRTAYRRYVRVYYDPRMPRWLQIAVIGHELSHAIEVANHPEVVDQRTLRLLYTQIGLGGDDHYDSEAAIEVGRAIARELSAGAVTSDHR